jgi:hypothetical protein
VTDTITTIPAGLSISIDGTTYSAPQTVNWTPGTSHTLAVLSPQGSGGVQNTLTGWSTGASTPQITVQAPSTGTTYTASFATQYLLTTGTSPIDVGAITGAGWYDAGTVATVQATAPANYKLAYFSGDLNGAANPQGVTMNGPKNVVANFQSTTTPTLNAAVTGKANGAAGQRVWTIRLANTGLGAATDVQITAAVPAQTQGVACSPAASVVTPLPISVGTIASGANGTGQVTLDFSGCADSTARFSLKVAFSANGGAYSGWATISNQTE